MKKYENLIKACCVFEFATIIIGVTIYIVFDLPNTAEFLNKYLGIMLGLFVFWGFLVFVLSCCPSPILKKLKKYDNIKVADKADVFFEDFNEFKVKIITEIEQSGYKQFETNSEYRKDKIFIYYKSHGLSNLYYVIMYADDENPEIILNETSKIFGQCLNTKDKWSSIIVLVSSILCVNRVSSTFYKYLGDISVSSKYEFELRAGYSFGGKTLYIGISPLKDIGISQTRKMRKYLLNILGVSKKELRK